jgi:cytochrome b561
MALRACGGGAALAGGGADRIHGRARLVHDEHRRRARFRHLVLLPVTGFIGASYTRSGVAFFGLELPRWRLPDHDTAEAFFEVHETIVWIMVGLVALHTLAALKHAFVDRDRVFRRMWF